MGSLAERRFAAIYELHFRDVLAYCLRRCPGSDAFDAANEVFAIAWRRIDDVPAGDAARPWLFVVAKRVLYRRRRSERRYRDLALRVAAEPIRSPLQPEAIAVRRAEYEAVHAAASRLSPADRELLSLAAWEGLPHSEISQVLGCSIGAVDQRLHRAKRRLAKQFHSIYGDTPMARVEGGEVS